MNSGNSSLTTTGYLSHQQKRDWIIGHTEVKFTERKKGDTKRQFIITINYFMEQEHDNHVPHLHVLYDSSS